MTYEWDNSKNQSNIAHHGVEFDLIHSFDWQTALVWVDTRRYYGETRMIALGLVNDRVFNCVFVERGENTRIISFRKANKRETLKWIGAQNE